MEQLRIIRAMGLFAALCISLTACMLDPSEDVQFGQHESALFSGF